MKVLSVVLLAAVLAVTLPEAWSGAVTSLPVATSGPAATATSACGAEVNCLQDDFSGNSVYSAAYALQYCQTQCRARGYNKSYISNGWCYCQYQQTNWSWGKGWGWGRGWGDDDD